MSPNEFIIRLANDSTTRGEKHIVDPPITDAELKKWEKANPSLKLPEDLVLLLRKANGIHPHANQEQKRGYLGLAQLEQWESARYVFWGKDTDAVYPPDTFIAISYHQDGSAYVVLDTKSGRYFLMDPCGPDESSPIGENVEDLLDWLWEEAVENLR